MIFLLFVATIALLIIARRVQVGAAVLVTLFAVMLTGLVATAVVSPVFLILALAVVAMIVRATHRAKTAPPPPIEGLSNLPPALQATVTRTLEQLSAGEAQELLLALVAQAGALHAASQRFDEREERETRRDVDDLVEACCDSTVELDRLDRVVATTPSRARRAPGSAPTPSGEVNQRLAAAREAIVHRLGDATTALRSLYVADLEQGSVASERVAILAAEIKADASARRRAIADVDSLLQ